MSSSTIDNATTNNTSTTSNSINKTLFNAFPYSVMKELQRTLALIIHETTCTNHPSMKATQRHELFFKLHHGNNSDGDFMSEIEKAQQRMGRHSLLFDEVDDVVTSTTGKSTDRKK